MARNRWDPTHLPRGAPGRPDSMKSPAPPMDLFQRLQFIAFCLYLFIMEVANGNNIFGGLLTDYLEVKQYVSINGLYLLRVK